MVLQHHRKGELGILHRSRVATKPSFTLLFFLNGNTASITLTSLKHYILRVPYRQRMRVGPFESTVHHCSHVVFVLTNGGILEGNRQPTGVCKTHVIGLDCAALLKELL
jgi:hypothetical protein